MKQTLGVLALLFFPVVFVGQNNPTTVFNSSGAFAQLSAPVSGTDLSLSVFRGTDSTGSLATFLVYNTFTSSQDSFTETFASGTIGNDAFNGKDPSHLTLTVDTSQLTDFSATTCTFSFVDFTFSCQPGAVGIIQLEWQQNRASTTHEVADVKQTFLKNLFQQHIEADFASANASGSFLNLMITDQFGQVGVNLNSNLEIFKQ